MNLWRYLLAIALIGHGIGHVMGFLAAWTKLPMGFSKVPWVLPGGFTINSAVGRAFGLLWLVAMIGFIGAGLGVLGIAVQQDWWRPLALASAVISLVAIVPWWNTVGPKLGPLLFDLIVLAGLLFWGDQLSKAIR